MIDAIGIVSGVLGIVGFIQDQIPDKPTEGAAIRIKAGSGGTDDEGSVSIISRSLSQNLLTRLPRVVKSQLPMPGTSITTISAEVTAALWSREE